MTKFMRLLVEDEVADEDDEEAEDEESWMRSS